MEEQGLSLYQHLRLICLQEALRTVSAPRGVEIDDILVAADEYYQFVKDGFPDKEEV